MSLNKSYLIIFRLQTLQTQVLPTEGLKKGQIKIYMFPNSKQLAFLFVRLKSNFTQI